MFGIDVSDNQEGKVDYAKVQVDFAIVRVSDGKSYTDKCYKQHVEGFRGAGIPVGIYHYFRAASDPIQQARRVANTGRELDVRLICADCEEVDGLSIGNFFKSASAFLQEIKSITSVTPILYALANFWPVWPAEFANFPLWVEHYLPIIDGGIADPHIPPPWKNWLLHQYAADPLPGIAPGHCDNVQGNVDLDRFSGSRDDLLALFGCQEGT